MTRLNQTFSLSFSLVLVVEDRGEEEGYDEKGAHLAFSLPGKKT